MDFLIVIVAKYLFLVELVAALVWAYQYTKGSREKLLKVLQLSVLALPIAYIIAKALGHFFYDPRPFVVDRTTPLVVHIADNGFPSDHVLLTMTIAAIVFMFNRKVGVILGILAVIVGIARVLAGVHHLIDILGSMVIAVLAVYISLQVLKKFPDFLKIKRIS